MLGVPDEIRDFLVVGSDEVVLAPSFHRDERCFLIGHWDVKVGGSPVMVLSVCRGFWFLFGDFGLGGLGGDFLHWK